MQQCGGRFLLHLDSGRFFANCARGGRPPATRSLWQFGDVCQFSVDHLIGAGKQREWNIKTKHPRRRLIDD